jgi:hypothetical protein
MTESDQICDSKSATNVGGGLDRLLLSSTLISTARRPGGVVWVTLQPIVLNLTSDAAITVVLDGLNPYHSDPTLQKSEGTPLIGRYFEKTQCDIARVQQNWGKAVQTVATYVLSRCNEPPCLLCRKKMHLPRNVRPYASPALRNSLFFRRLVQIWHGDSDRL